MPGAHDRHTGDQRDPVLVVEDDPDMRRVIAWTLEDSGLPVETAADGRAAIDWVAQSKPSLLVLDMGLPVVDGDGVARRLHESYGDSVPILVMTADGRAEAKARRVGAVDYLIKPFNLEDLILTVRRALATR